MIPFTSHAMYISVICVLVLCIFALLGVIRTYKVTLTKRQMEALDRIEQMEKAIAVSQQDVSEQLRTYNDIER